MKYINLYFSLCIINVAFLHSAKAIEYTNDNYTLKLKVDGMIGAFNTKHDNVSLINDWHIKTHFGYSLDSAKSFGLVYSIDSDTITDKKYKHDAFIFLENTRIGRSEIGFTHSVARKLGLGLPDVGYLRINDKSLLYKNINNHKNIIADTIITTTYEAPRINFATPTTKYGQYGFSLSGLGDKFDYSLDFAIKYKQSTNKLKTAYYIALSYMDNPLNYKENSFSNITTANSKSQFALGFNLQYNSYIFGLSSRLIYDDKPINNKSSDGLIIGTGISYELLKYSISCSYLFSDTSLWKHSSTVGEYIHTIIGSLRYKYSQYASISLSTGYTYSNPFISAGIKVEF